MKKMLKIMAILVALCIVMVGCFVFILKKDPTSNDKSDSSEAITSETVSSETSTDTVNDVTVVSTVQSPMYKPNKQDDYSEAQPEPEAQVSEAQAEIQASEVSPEAQAFLNAVKNVYEMVYNGNYQYGDSKSSPPCDDGFISGDRLVARALWDMGYTDQPSGGVTNFDSYLPDHGFEVIYDKSMLRAGDIVQISVYDRPDRAPNNPITYTFVLVSYDPNTERCLKYDMSLTADLKSRINSIQPIDALLEENGSMRIFKRAFRIK